MAFGWFVLAIAYLAIVFWLGRWGEKYSPLARKVTSHPLTYSLSLAIYCTAWTFFGAVGEAVRDQWNYLPIFLGPFLLYIFGHQFLKKLVFVSKKHHITTIADFIASRYGKRQTVALLVTLIALLATIPYIALQLKAIGSAFVTVSGNENSGSIVTIATLFIGLFSIYFGTQRTDVTEYRHGLMMAIAFESLIKLAALLLMAFVAYVIWNKNPDVSLFMPQATQPVAQTPAYLTSGFWMQTLLAMGATICLPRQFHVAILHNIKEDHLNTARWVFPVYLLLIALSIPIISNVGAAIFAGTEIRPDTYVLELALHSQSTALTALVFLGGLSAATAMIIIATLTLSTMITNDVILPKLLDNTKDHQQSNLHLQKILWIRRGVIAGLLFFAYLYHQQLTTNTSLASIGLLAFSLVIQLIPAIVGGLYWKQAHAHGVYAGLLAGVFCWVLWLFIPLYGELEQQPVNNELINQAAIYSLIINSLFYIFFSRLAKPRLIDKIQAQAFVDTQFNRPRTTPDNTKGSIYNEDLLTVLETFLGKDRSAQLVSSYEQNVNNLVEPQKPPTDDFIQFCERALGGVIGSSSATILIESVVSNQRMNFEQVIQVFDETTQALQMNQSALFASLGSLDQGISVIDKSLNLVAWNQAYLDMFAYPKGLVGFGVPVETLVRFNALRGECGVGEVESLVQKRLEHLRSGKPHKFVRQRSDGKVIEMVGNPLPQGGFVTSFNDITQHIELQQALKESNIDLEKRVESRSAEVKAINEDLRTEIERRAEIETQLIEARKIAETANLSKTRFLALASHDILQPINAAKLYLAAIKESIPSGDLRTMIEKLDASINASDNMIGTLLEIARLDQGEMQPKPEPIHLIKLLTPLIDEFNMKASTKGLTFSTSVHDVWLNADPTYLQRIVRNLLSNAIKYTNRGRVVFTVRKNLNNAIFSVWDTGVGISKHDQERIFEDFYRINDSVARGVGLGLSVVNRLSEQIGSHIEVMSRLGKGSCFRFCLPTIAPQEVSRPAIAKPQTGFNSLNVLCVDDEAENLEALQTLLSKWQIIVNTATDPNQAIKLADSQNPQALLIDYQLGERMNGIELIDKLRARLSNETPAILVTAVRDESLVSKLEKKHIHYLSKPVKPAKLRALLFSLKPKH